MVTTRIVPLLIAGLVGVELAMATRISAGAQTREVSAAEYAKAMCAALHEVVRFEGVTVQGMDEHGPGNFASSRQQALDLTAQYRKAWADAGATLQATSPKVREGETIGRLFTDYTTQAIGEIQKAVDAFTGVDPAASTYRTALTDLGMAMYNIRNTLVDPVAMVADRGVREAFGSEKACGDLFPSLIDPNGRFTEYPVPLRHPFVMAAGPDGNAWFTAMQASALGKIDVKTGWVTARFPFPPVSPPLAGSRRVQTGTCGSLHATPTRR